MSKKILSLALVVVMLFSTFAISSSAAVSDGQVGIKIETNATVGMAAGESVWVKIYYEVPTTDGYTHANSNVVLAYTDAFELDTDAANIGTTSCYDAREWGASYAEYFKEDSTVSTKSTVYSSVSGKFTDNDKAKNWTSAVMVQQATNTDNGYTATSGYPIDPACEVFTLNFVTKRALTAEDSIGVPEASVTMGQTLMKYINSAGKSVAYSKSLDVIVVDEAVAYAAAPTKADVYKLADPRKHVNADGTSTVAAFFAFDAATIAPDFVSGTSQFITGITATITATSGGQTITVTPDAIKYVYDINKDGTVYGFRVIMKNVPADAVITVVPAVATKDNATYTVDTLNINVASVTAY